MINRKISLIDQQVLLTQYMKKATRSLKGRPEGSLIVSSCHGSVQYFHRKEMGAHHGSYIPKKETKLIQSLAQKDYDQKFLRKADEVMKDLKKLEKLGGDRSIGDMYEALARVYTDLGENRMELVFPYVPPDDMFVKAWEETEYVGNDYPFPSAEIITEKGERVRSKSEKILADKFFSMGIPYRYEYPHTLDSGEVVYPDFSLLHVRERRVITMEHYGLMDSTEYALKTISKIEAYENSGYITGYDFFYTFESADHTLNMKLLERKLKEMFFLT